MATCLLLVAQQQHHSHPTGTNCTCPDHVTTGCRHRPPASAGGSLSLDQPAAAGSWLGLTLREQPAAVEIIPGEVIRERGDMTTQDAATRATGITAAGTPGDGSSVLVSRGFAGHSSVTQLYDGTRLYIAAGTMTFPTDTWLLDRVEVLRGPASVIHGVGAIGGAINYVPRQAQGSKNVTEVLASAGSFDTYHFGVNSNGPLWGPLSYQLGVIGTLSDGCVSRGDSNRVSLASELAYSVTSDLKLSLHFDGAWNEPARYWGTPLINGAIDDRLRDNNYNVENSVVRWHDYWMRLRADWQIMSGFSVQNEVYVLLTDRHWRNVEAYEFLPATNAVSRFDYLEILHDQLQVGNRLVARLDGTVAGRPYRVLGGFDVNFIDFRHTNNSPFEGDSVVDAFHPVPGRFINIAGTIPKFDTNTTQVSFFSEGWLQIAAPFKLLAGVRVDSIDYTRKDLVNAANSFGADFTPVTWRIGGVFDITRHIAAYAQVARGVDPLGSLITLPLSQRQTKLTTAWQYEVGVKTQLPDGWGDITLAGYYIVKDNLLARDPARPSETIQIGQQSAAGFEATLGLRPLPQLAIDANITALDARFDDFLEVQGNVPVSRNGKQPPNVPEFAANLWVVYTPVSAWRLGGGVRHVGERFGDNANTVRAPPYTLLNAFVTYAPAKFVEVTLRGRNLTDVSYAIAPYTDTQFILGEPRAMEGVINLRF